MSCSVTQISFKSNVIKKRKMKKNKTNRGTNGKWKNWDKFNAFYCIVLHLHCTSVMSEFAGTSFSARNTILMLLWKILKKHYSSRELVDMTKDMY